MNGTVEFNGDVAVVSTSGSGECGVGIYTDHFVDWLRTAGVQTDRVTVPHEGYDPRPYVRAVAGAVQSGPDVIHLQHHYPVLGRRGVFTPLVCAQLDIWADAPLVVTMHGVETPEDFSVRTKRLGVQVINRAIARTFDRICFLSDAEEAKFRSHTGVAASAIRRVDHGTYEGDRSSDPEKARESFGYAPDQPLVVEPGYVREQKGSHRLPKIAERLPDVEFMLAGGARVERNEPYLAEIRESAPSNLSITGVLDDDRFQAAIAAADVVALPYESVTQSGVLNWCAAYRTPAITTPLEHFRDLATDFDYPALFESDDIGVMADGIRELLADESRRSRLRERAAEFHRANGKDQVVEDYLRIYRDVLDDA